MAKQQISNYIFGFVILGIVIVLIIARDRYKKSQAIERDK